MKRILIWIVVANLVLAIIAYIQGVRTHDVFYLVLAALDYKISNKIAGIIKENEK